MLIPYESNHTKYVMLIPCESNHTKYVMLIPYESNHFMVEYITGFLFPPGHQPLADILAKWHDKIRVFRPILTWSYIGKS